MPETNTYIYRGVARDECAVSRAETTQHISRVPPSLFLRGQAAGGQKEEGGQKAERQKVGGGRVGGRAVGGYHPRDLVTLSFITR